ncbi:hypothetical protein AB1N83_008456 [Pleurotus pulmonarius]
MPTCSVILKIIPGKSIGGNGVMRKAWSCHYTPAQVFPGYRRFDTLAPQCRVWVPPTRRMDGIVLEDNKLP